MANMIDHALDDAVLQRVKANLEETYSDLRPNCVTLTGDARKELAPARNNYEKYLVLMMQIADAHGIKVPQCSEESVKIDLKVQSDMTLLLDQIGTLYTMVLDSYRLARTEGWKAFLAFYNILNAFSAQDAEILDRMKPVLEFMSRNGKKSDNQAEEPVDLVAEAKAELTSGEDK